MATEPARHSHTSIYFSQSPFPFFHLFLDQFHLLPRGGFKTDFRIEIMHVFALAAYEFLCNL